MTEAKKGNNLFRRIKNVFATKSEQEPKLTPTSSIDVSEKDSHQYTSDQPISTRSEDRFNRSSFATRIADTIATRVDRSSIVIGLYAPWGDGKTSVLEMMEETIKEYPHVVTIRFNPWHFQSEDLLLRGFFSTLAVAIDQSLPNLKEKVGELLQKYEALLSLGSMTINGLTGVDPGEAVKGLAKSLSSVELDELKSRIESLLDLSGKRVVVLIDDIDRLDRNETHTILKLVKLSASFRNTSYVLAFDDAVVSAAIGERYGQGGQEAGRAFLEKIIQVPLHLPPADETSLRQLAFEGVNRALTQAGISLEQNHADAFSRHFVDGLEQKMVTPRLAKLYTNALTFALPILKGEVDPVDLMLIEGIRVFYPNLYVQIRSNPDLFLKGIQNNPEIFGENQPLNSIDLLIKASLPEATEKERERLKRRLLEPLFPRLSNMIYGREWDKAWSGKQKVCSSQYFKRYFTYGVPEGDVADTQITSLIHDLAEANEAEQSHLLDVFVSRRAIPRLISKLRDHADDISENEANALMFAIARNANILPRERGPFMMGGTWMQGAILICQLLKRLPIGERRQVAAEEVIRLATPLSFGIQCLRWIRHTSDQPEEQRLLSVEAEGSVKQILVERIQHDELQSPMYLQHPKDAPMLYWQWADVLGKNSVSEALQSRFQSEPSNVDTFLDCYVGEGWGVETGLPVRSDFDRDNYNSIAEVITPELIAVNLKQRFGEELNTPSYHLDSETNLAKRIAHQFMYIHNHVQQELQQESNNEPH